MHENMATYYSIGNLVAKLILTEFLNEMIKCLGFN